MDLPQTVRPSRLSPHYFKGYLVSGVLVLVLAGSIWMVAPYLGFLPFSTFYLYGIALLPFIKAFLVEMARRRNKYEFYEDRVMVRHGLETVEQEDVPYSKITDISSVTPPFEELVNVGDLELHIAGTKKTVHINGLKGPEQYEELMLGRYEGDEADAAMGNGSEDQLAEVQEELQQLEQRYNNGEIGRAEYEQNYYYLQGKRDAYQEIQER